jgi:hypothetical protein
LKQLTKYSSVLYSIFFVSLLLLVFYCFREFGIACHFEEWTGRGLYPALALTNGFDLYETTKGPLITLYGFGTALFYSPTFIANNPTESIWIAYLCNLGGLFFPISYLVWKLIEKDELPKYLRSYAIIIITSLLILLLQLESTTQGSLKIHADTPAISFILCSLAFFIKYEDKKRRGFLFLTSLCLTFAAWSKLPALPALFFPQLYFLFDKRIKEALLSALLSFLCLSLISILIFCAYGFHDVFYYLYQFPSGSMWSYRNELFDGTNAVLKTHSYIEGIPLLFRFLIMYIGEYWYLLLSSITLLFMSFKVDNKLKAIYRCISLVAFLTLPTCLAHLARFGAVENALVFTNLFSIFCFVIVMFHLIRNFAPSKHMGLIVSFIALLFMLPTLRTARALPTSTVHSPHQQAFEYLKTGKKDVYFGWYPISHLLYSGDNLTSIEVPTWVGMNQPDAINFDLSHIPEGAKYLATSPTGYGSTMLEQYIGDLKEVASPKELSSWRLFEIKALSNIK